MPEVRIFRGGRLEAGSVAAGEVRRTLNDLPDDAWLWVDDVDPTAADVTALQAELDLHDLAVEDVQHRGQRPKVEFFPDHLFAVLRPLSMAPEGLVETELFLFASPRFLVTLRFSPTCDLTSAVRRWPVLATVAPGVGSALYAIADEVADDYLDVVEILENRADELEGGVFDAGSSTHDRARWQLDVFRLRRDAVKLRRHAVPTRQAVDRLSDDSDLVTAGLLPYLRDITDPLLRTIELADGVREVLTTIVDIRTAQAANQLNEVMKKLSAWAGIILVPTLIAGIYGMNFRRMPELDWLLGYPMALVLMAVSASLLYLGFRKRGWL